MLSGKELAEHAANYKTKILSAGYKLVEVPKSDDELQRLKQIEENFKYLTCLSKVDRQDSRSHGIYDSQKHRIKLTKTSKNVQKYFGSTELKQLYLKPYEALYLIEINDLVLYFNDVIVCLEQAYALLLGIEKNSFEIEKYIAYSWLFRSGYIVQPYKDYKTLKSTEPKDSIHDQIWNNLSRNLNLLNRRQVLGSELSIQIVEEFNQVREQFLTTSTKQSPPTKKFKANSLQDEKSSYLDENDVLEFNEIFKQLRLVVEETFKPDLEKVFFDFNLYSSEEAVNFSRNNPGKPEFYAKIVKMNSNLDTETLNRSISTADGVPVMLVIVLDNLSILSYICS